MGFQCGVQQLNVAAQLWSDIYRHSALGDLELLFSIYGKLIYAQMEIS